jgi:hypothetical protein
LKCSPDSTEEGTIALLLQGLDSLVGQGGASLLEGLKTSIEVDEAEVEVQRRRQSLQNPTTGL